MKKIIILLSMMMFSICFSELVEGDIIGSFNVQTLDGKTAVSSNEILKNKKNKLLVIAAEWCIHCKREAPILQKLKNNKKLDVIVIYTSYESNLNKVNSFLKANKYTYKSYFDNNNEALEKLEVNGFPHNILLDANNKIIQIQEGVIDINKLNEKLEVK